MYAMAHMNHHGIGMRADLNSAIEYYQKAADEGEPAS